MSGKILPEAKRMAQIQGQPEFHDNPPAPIHFVIKSMHQDDGCQDDFAPCPQDNGRSGPEPATEGESSGNALCVQGHTGCESVVMNKTMAIT